MIRHSFIPTTRKSRHVMNPKLTRGSFPQLLSEIRKCRVCEEHLPCGPRPILVAHQLAPILIVGQAPGRRVHETGIAWNDPSGNRLREWLGVERETFYDETKIAIVPMGFCYPGTGKFGDLPPRPECADLWHDQLLAELTSVKLTLVVGTYAQKYRLGKRCKSTLTETVKSWKEYRPSCLTLPHPSPRNNRWLKNNPWFVDDVLPYLKSRVKRLLK